MSAVPFPLDVVLAPLAAAGAFTAVLAFESLASAQHGAVMPADMPVFAHAGEMVLPRQLSEGMQRMIGETETGGRPGAALVRERRDHAINIAHKHHVSYKIVLKIAREEHGCVRFRAGYGLPAFSSDFPQKQRKKVNGREK